MAKPYSAPGRIFVRERTKPVSDVPSERPSSARGAAFVSGGLVAIIAGIFGLGDLPKDYSDARAKQCEIAVAIVTDETTNTDVPAAERRMTASRANRRLASCLEEKPWTFFGFF